MPVMLQALSFDVLNMIFWTKTKDAQKGRNKPKSLFKELMGLEKKQSDDLMSFRTPEEFERWRRRKIRG